MPYITSFERLAKEEGVQKGVTEERKQVIQNLLKMRFGDLDEALTATIEPLLNLPAEEYTRLLLEGSREELIAWFEGRSPTLKSPSSNDQTSATNLRTRSFDPGTRSFEPKGG
jgi:hypothetical protein